tara:strand:+ start:250 stop:456 length:207 start_codon:yes stop_codon:yes gene_type:complete
MVLCITRTSINGTEQMGHCRETQVMTLVVVCHHGGDLGMHLFVNSMMLVSQTQISGLIVLPLMAVSPA